MMQTLLISVAVCLTGIMLINIVEHFGLKKVL